MKVLVLALALVAACGGGVKVKTEYVVDPATSGVVRGTVMSEAGPAAGATLIIKLPHVELSAITDENGAFDLHQALPVGRYKLVIFYINQRTEREIEVRPDSATVVRVTGLEDHGEI